MEFFDQNLIVSDIQIAMRVSPGRETRSHPCRSSHGFVYHSDYISNYCFASGKVLTCRSGQCIYLPKGSNYYVDPITSGAAANESAPDLTQATNTPPGAYAINFYLLNCDTIFEPFIIDVKGKDKVLSYFQKAIFAWRKKQPGYMEECLCSVYRLIQQFRKESSTYSQRNRIIDKLTPALQYIDAHYTTENISSPLLASLCGVSESQLRNLFNAAFSVPPATYIRNLRICFAKDLLISSDHSVASVAYLSGFSTPIYFCREFKKATGMSPHQYSKHNS